MYAYGVVDREFDSVPNQTKDPKNRDSDLSWLT